MFVIQIVVVVVFIDACAHAMRDFKAEVFVAQGCEYFVSVEAAFVGIDAVMVAYLKSRVRTQRAAVSGDGVHLHGGAAILPDGKIIAQIKPPRCFITPRSEERRVGKESR